MENKNIIIALVKAQREISPPTKSGTNPMFKNKYATLDDILNSVRGALSKYEIIATCSVERDEFGFYALARLLHVSGEVLESKFPMMLEKQTNQGIASARTYAFRYVLCNILALPSDEDDDGNATLKPYQVKELEETIGGDEALADMVLKGYEKKYKKPVRHFGEIRQEDFAPAIAKLKSNPKPIQRAV